MAVITAKKSDEEGYNAYYKGQVVDGGGSKENYMTIFERQVRPFYLGGPTKGYARGVALQSLLAAVEASGNQPEDLTVLDAGSGLGRLSAYLACKGFNVVGIDISSEGCATGQKLADELGVSDHCRFHAESLESTSLDDSSINFILGHGTLHHFIKYEQVPAEFKRILKVGGEGFFADSFSENRVYRIFHDKKKMEKLGDVPLTRRMIFEYFRGFEVKLLPMDWFVMLDKLYLKLLPKAAVPLVRKLSRVHFWLDRRIPADSPLALALSGSVMTSIRRV